MHPIRVYADTSVFGGLSDEEFSLPSRAFFERARAGELLLLVSTEVLRELQAAPPLVRAILDDLPERCIEHAPVLADALNLAQAYVNAGILGAASRADAVHVACATVAGADVIVSWNFRHIVNYDRIGKYNAVNVLQGYREIDIRSPAELVYGEREAENEDL